MAATNQRNKSDGRKRQSGGQSAVSRAKSQATHAMEEVRDEVSGYVSRGVAQAREMTRDHEGTAVLVALAAGFGVGLVIGCALAPSHQRERSWTDRITAEGLGRRMLEGIESVIPTAITDRFSR